MEKHGQGVGLMSFWEPNDTLIMVYIEHHQHWGNYEMQLYTYMAML